MSISYKNLYGPNDGSVGEYVSDRQRFRAVSRTGFNATDSIDVRFFKILFYFYNQYTDDTKGLDTFIGGSSGLLSPTWLDNPTGDYYKYNSAWAYLKNNYEDERASLLKDFVELLSLISSESPWYFKSISGVDEALVRENWVVPNERKKISIVCMADPIDHRIESLISMYRSIVWSHVRKCEVLPANLRKFDMGLFVFSGLNHNLHAPVGPYGWASLNGKDTNSATYKYIEFHNCEISMDSLKSGYGEMSNESGISQEFTIDIYFDDCYENEYNQFIMKEFGDMFIWDRWQKIGIGENGESAGDPPVWSEDEELNEMLELELNNRLYRYSGSSQQETSNIQQLIGNGKETIQSALTEIKDSAKEKFKELYDGGLGNIYGKGAGMQGLTEAVSMEMNKQISSLKNKVIGNITGTLDKAAKTVTDTVKKPILGVMNAGGNLVDKAIDTIENVTVKPVLGTLYTIENAVVRTTQTGTSYLDEAGEKMKKESEELGNLAYDSQVRLSNNIGKNRLNANLGKL